MFHHHLSLFTHPEVVESGAGHALPGDVLGERLDHAGVLLHAQHGARDELAVRAHRKVPRTDAHHVVERELNY